MKAMILAAGRGERMRPLTNTTPKALLVVRGKPLIEYHIEALVRAGIRDIVINLAWLGEQVRFHLGQGEKYGANIVYSDEGCFALETGGGILKALPLLGNAPFWVVNADIYTDFEFSARRLEDGMLAHLVMVRNPDHNARGDFALIDGRIGLHDAPAFTFSGLSVIHSDLLRGVGTGTFRLAPLLTGSAASARQQQKTTPSDTGEVGPADRIEAQLGQNETKFDTGEGGPVVLE